MAKRSRTINNFSRSLETFSHLENGNNPLLALQHCNGPTIASGSYVLAVKNLFPSAVEFLAIQQQM